MQEKTPAMLDVKYSLADLMSTKNEADQAGQHYDQQNATANSNAYNSFYARAHKQTSVEVLSS